MHILIFCEQHPHTLGGAQMSVVLQAKFLERLGHTVTFVSPALRTGPVASSQFIDLPSWPIPSVKHYTWLWPRTSHLRLIEKGLESRPPVDIVHVQSDFWGAAFGYRFALERSVPIVHTMHNRLDVGIDRAFPFPGLLYAMLGSWQRWALRDRVSPRPRGAFEFLARFAARADAVVSPSRHFATLLESKGVHTVSGRPLDVIPTGIDDDLVREVTDTRSKASGPIRLVWVGRFSPEKRLLEFCEALTLVTAPIEVTIVGDGALRARAEAVAPTFVRFVGSLPYRDALAAIAGADVLVQSSNGFETQGMTVTEAVALGTHVVLVDPEIAAELPDESRSITDDDTPAALARVIDECATKRETLRSGRSAAVTGGLLQSSRTTDMVAVYESVSRDGVA